MPQAVFPYPGGKSRFASWILDYVPEHRTFVEVFGGAAGVLANKDPDCSGVEVYNDVDEDLVQFFTVLREQPDELVEWLHQVPYSRQLHSEWAQYYYRGYRPIDDVERAGRFFYLRYSQWGASYSSNSGFATSKVNSRAQSYSNKIDKLQAFAGRFDAVIIENLDWRDVLEKYDSAETVFYLDPPYVGKEDYYPAGVINHDRLVESLCDLEGDAICSYEKLPDDIDGLFSVTRDGEKRFINNGKSGEAKDAVERLLFNFDPTA
ncbi:DNA adenine methylase [Haladaptatus sp. ZSTT2]|uniref:DNA adenine methylase n=1 Tax=Haladaptatus sp. ZSTT2 TaxID=3120515 RepID=UPI00300E8234